MFWSMAQSARAGQPAVYAEAGVAGSHNGLVPMFKTNLIEHPCDMVASRFYRKSERCGDLRVVETLGDPFQHGALTRREFIERQCVVIGEIHVVGGRAKTNVLVHDARTVSR